MRVDEGISATANLTKVGKGRNTTEPEFVGCPAIQRGSGSEVGKESSGGRKFVPEVLRSFACKAHSAGFVRQGAVEAFCSAIVRGCVWSSKPHNVANYMRCVRRNPRAKRPLISDKPTWAH